jgi:hypothetical protein
MDRASQSLKCEVDTTGMWFTEAVLFCEGHHQLAIKLELEAASAEFSRSVSI